MHGSSEGRFTVTYCPGPALERRAVEGVGFGYLPLEQALARFPLEAGGDRQRLDAAGDSYYSIANPGLGLWRTQTWLTG